MYIYIYTWAGDRAAWADGGGETGLDLGAGADDLISLSLSLSLSLYIYIYI